MMLGFLNFFNDKLVTEIGQKYQMGSFLQIFLLKWVCFKAIYFMGLFFTYPRRTFHES